MNRQLRYLKELDYSVLVLVAALAVFSYLGISGASPNSDFAQKQMTWYMVGFGLMAAVLMVDDRLLRWLAPALYGVGILLLMGVLVIGEVTHGAVSWYQLPGGLAFQPSEYMKVALILMLAWYFSGCEEKGKVPERFTDLFIPFLLLGLPLTLILLQPDLGTSLVFLFLFLFMIVVAKVKWTHLMVLFFIAALILAGFVALYLWAPDIFFSIIDDYQWKRLTTFINPDEGPSDARYQLEQSLIAVGSGQLVGKGLYQGAQGQGQWVPEAHTDFIFSVIAEEHGFLGASLLIILFFALIYRLIRIAAEARDSFGAYVIMGIVGMWTFHILENIGMTIGLMPITGIPLPFISYGGSSLVTNFLALGIALNIGMRRKKLMF